MEEASVLAYLAALGLIFATITVAYIQPGPPTELNHPQPQVDPLPAPAKAAEAYASETEHKHGQPERPVKRETRRTPRTSEKATNAHAEERPLRSWSPLDIH